MKNLKYYLVTIGAVVVSFCLVQGIIFASFLSKQLENILQLRIDPAFKGGEIIARFNDPIGDDYGEGELVYPHNKVYSNAIGSLDIIKYTVYQPQTSARWSDLSDFWQVSFTFARTKDETGIHGFAHPVIHLYIDIDGQEGGSLESASARSELVVFDTLHPWDFMLEVNGYHENAKLISFDKEIKIEAQVIVDTQYRTIYVRIPLTNKRIKPILDGRNTYHYVLVGAYDPFATGNFMPIKTKASQHNGGGAKSTITPRVYDYIPPAGQMFICLYPKRFLPRTTRLLLIF